MFKKKRAQSQVRSTRPQPSGGQFQRNSLVISKTQRETEQHKQSVAQRQVDQRRARERTLYKRRILAAVIVVATLTVLYGLRVRSLTLVTDKRIRNIDTSVYHERIDSYLTNKVVLRQSWLVDDAQLQEYVQSKYPEVERIIASSPSLVGGELHVDIAFREPHYIWKTASGIQYIDDTGVLFSDNVYGSIDVATLPVVEDQSSAGFEDGSAVLSSHVAEYIAYVYANVPDLFAVDSTITSVILPPKAREINVKVSTVPYAIKLSTERGIEEQVTELGELITYLNEVGTQPAEYVDVRVENKAFYK